MPIYEFDCLDCKKKFEVTQAIRDYDPKKVACPDCGRKKVERVWSEVFALTSKKS
jgi:putative FmdB family regulatory protein